MIGATVQPRSHDWDMLIHEAAKIVKDYKAQTPATKARSGERHTSETSFFFDAPRQLLRFLQSSQCYNLSPEFALD